MAAPPELFGIILVCVSIIYATYKKKTTLALALIIALLALLKLLGIL